MIMNMLQKNETERENRKLIDERNQMRIEKNEILNKLSTLERRSKMEKEEFIIRLRQGQEIYQQEIQKKEISKRDASEARKELDHRNTQLKRSQDDLEEYRKLLATKVPDIACALRDMRKQEQHQENLLQKVQKERDDLRQQLVTLQYEQEQKIEEIRIEMETRLKEEDMIRNKKLEKVRETEDKLQDSYREIDALRAAFEKLNHESQEYLYGQL